MIQHADILKRNGLSVTASRTKILDLFLAAEGALAHADIEKNTDAAYDRVTVYRTLQTFLRILDQIPALSCLGGRLDQCCGFVSRCSLILLLST